MKARVRKDGGFYIGEVWGVWESHLYGFYIGAWKGWKNVTGNCFTEYGAKQKIKSWKKRNIPSEFNI